LQGAVEQADVRGAQVRAQGLFVHREAMVLAGDDTRPESRSFTGWLAPWWPNFILKVFAPEASARIWWPRQIPKVGMPLSISSLTAAMA
jgi:hypothetical protein